MSAEAPDELAPRRCRAQDVAALIGLLALIEGEIVVSEVPPHLSDRIRRRLKRETLLQPNGPSKTCVRRPVT